MALVAGGPHPTGSVRTGQLPGGDQHELTYDEQLGAVAEQVPSFAGLYVDGETYVIKVTDGRHESAGRPVGPRPKPSIVQGLPLLRSAPSWLNSRGSNSWTGIRRSLPGCGGSPTSP